MQEARLSITTAVRVVFPVLGIPGQNNGQNNVCWLISTHSLNVAESESR